MAHVAVVSDTTHYLPRELVDADGIGQVSLYVNWDGRTDREADLPDFDAYYEHLRAAPELPTTSQPSVGDFIAVYEPLLAEGRDIVSIHLVRRHLGHLRVGPPGAGPADRGRPRGRAHHGHGLRDDRRRARHGRCWPPRRRRATAASATPWRRTPRRRATR